MVASWVRFQDWALDNARILLGVVGVIAAVAVIGVLWMRSRADAETKASGRLAEVSALYWRGEYGPLTQRAADIRREFPGTKAAAEATRIMGDAAFWQGDFKKAAAEYQEFLKHEDKDSPVRPGVERSLAQALESDRQFPKAAELYERLSKEPVTRMDQGDLALSAARAWEAAGNSAKAKALYERVATDYTDTPFAAEAEMRLGELQGRGK